MNVNGVRIIKRNDKNMKIILLVITCIYMLWISVEDIIKKMLSVKMLILGFMLVPVFLFVFDEIPFYDRILGMLPGVLMLICSIVSRGRIGYADGFVILMLGICMGLADVILITTIAFLTIGIFSAVMIALKKIRFKSTIPFIPFMFIGFLAAMVSLLRRI